MATTASQPRSTPTAWASTPWSPRWFHSTAGPASDRRACSPTLARGSNCELQSRAAGRRWECAKRSGNRPSRPPTRTRQTRIGQPILKRDSLQEMAASRAGGRSKVTRRLTLEWPDPAPSRDRNDASNRIPAVSDVLEPTLIDARNRSALVPIDFIVGCGDLDHHDLAFIADGFNAPLLYVHGNNDSNESWRPSQDSCPEPIQSTATHRQAGLSIAGLTWPAIRGKGGQRSETVAWKQAMRLATRRLGRLEPLLVLSHVPPLCCGDVARRMACFQATVSLRWPPLPRMA